MLVMGGERESSLMSEQQPLKLLHIHVADSNVSLSIVLAPGGDAHLPDNIKAIQLTQQLHECALDLAVGGGALAEALAPNGIDLIHEDDAGLVLLGIAEHLADEPRALPDVLVHDRGGHHLEEVGVDVAGDGSRQQCFPCRQDDRRHWVRIIELAHDIWFACRSGWIGRRPPCCMRGMNHDEPNF